MSFKLRELRALTDDELIEKYDEKASSTSVGLNYYTEELNRRSNENTNKIMVRCTIWITIMTAIMLLATLVNVLLVIKK